MALHFSTFYAHVPHNDATSTFHPTTEVSHKRSIKMINMLFGSARAFNPGSRFSILTSASTDLSRVKVPFRRVDIPIERCSLMLDRTIGQRRLVAELPTDETLLMLDNDMIVQSDLSHLEALPFDIAVTWRPERVPINGGFIAARNRDDNRALRFFDEFVRLYRERSADDQQWYGDQFVLRDMLPTHLKWGPDMLTKPYDGATIHFLHSNEYNYAPKDGEPTLDVQGLRGRRLLHFKGKRKSAMLPYYADLRRDHRTVLTPYSIPAAMTGHKVANIGDGFILRSVQRLFGKVPKAHILSPRIAPSPKNENIMAVGDFIILAGANQLNDNYTIWPGLTAEALRSHDYRFLPVGIGLHGAPEKTVAMSEATAEILRAIHERIKYSSWRCPMTVAYLEASLPELKGRFLMTGCPVIFDKPLLNNRAFHQGCDHIAVTITDRGENWFKRESVTLRAVHGRYPTARKSLVLHQDFARISDPARPSPTDLLRQKLFEEATMLGFEIHAPTASEAVALYHTVDMHFGSRVHAHLLMLSRNRKSFVTAVDDRTLGLSRAFKFPILRLRNLDLDQALAFDFEQIREKALHVHETMQKFVASAQALR